MKAAVIEDVTHVKTTNNQMKKYSIILKCCLSDKDKLWAKHLFFVSNKTFTSTESELAGRNDHGNSCLNKTKL